MLKLETVGGREPVPVPKCTLSWGFGASWQRVGLDVEETVVDEVVELVEGRDAAVQCRVKVIRGNDEPTRTKHVCR